MPLRTVAPRVRGGSGLLLYVLSALEKQLLIKMGRLFTMDRYEICWRD